MHVLPSPLPTLHAFAFGVARTDETRASLSASGELDLAATQDLVEMLAAQEAAGRTFIRLDLSAVTFMDCSCLGILVGAHYRLRAAGGQLILTSSSGPVTRLLSATHLEDVLLADADSAPERVPLPRVPPKERPVENAGTAS